MDLTHDAATEADPQLARYLAARGLPAALAAGPVGARRRAFDEASPNAVFAAWFAKLLDAPVEDAESLGWIAFLSAGMPPDALLAPLDADALETLRARVPRPAVEAPLAMPVQSLSRAAAPRRAGARRWTTPIARALSRRIMKARAA